MIWEYPCFRKPPFSMIALRRRKINPATSACRLGLIGKLNLKYLNTKQLQIPIRNRKQLHTVDLSFFWFQVWFGDVPMEQGPKVPEMLPISPEKLCGEKANSPTQA